MINVRVETGHEKQAFRRAFAERRCLLPADGFYEWTAVAATEDRKAYKQPWFIAPEEEATQPYRLDSRCRASGVWHSEAIGLGEAGWLTQGIRSRVKPADEAE